jgi:hypothetical protein
VITRKIERTAQAGEAAADPQTTDDEHRQSCLGARRLCRICRIPGNLMGQFRSDSELAMKFRRKPKFSVTGVSFPVIGGGVTWSNNADERQARARSERADAFAELWNIAQSAHIGVRNNFDNVDVLADVHRQLNVLLIQKAPALDPEDVDLAQNFLSALDEFIRLLRPLPGVSADHVREEMAATRDPLLVPGELDVLLEANSRMSVYNESLGRRYREVVFGEGT